MTRLLTELRGWGVWDSLPSAFTLLTCVVMLCMASRADAQFLSGQLPPLRQVLTDPTAPSPTNHGLHLSLSAFESYDDNDVLVGSQSTTTEPVYHTTGLRTGGIGMLTYSYSRNSSRLSLGTHATAGAHAYTTSGRVYTRASGGVSAGVPLGERTRVLATTTVRYAPYYNFGLFQGINALGQGGAINSIDPEIDLAVAPRSSLIYGLSTGISHQLTRLTSAEFFYDLSSSAFREGPGFKAQRFGGRFRHQLTRDLSARVGYNYGRSTYGTFQGPQLHNLDVGLDFARGLSFTRGRTTVAFSFGSVLAGHSSGPSPQFKLDREHLRLTGMARINREIGRTWSASLFYRRGFEFVDTFNELFFMDSVTAGFGGALNSRTSVGVSGSYLRGTVGLRSGNRHEAYHGLATIRYGFTTWASCYAQSNLYRFELPNSLTMPVGFPAALTRRGVRAGVAMNLQLFPRGR